MYCVNNVICYTGAYHLNRKEKMKLINQLYDLELLKKEVLRYMRSSGLTTNEVAKKIGIGYYTLNNFFYMSNTPRLQTAMKIDKFLETVQALDDGEA